MRRSCSAPRRSDQEIGELGAAAEAMAGKDKAQSRQKGALQLVHALETYGEFFDHPGWTESATKHEH